MRSCEAMTVEATPWKARPSDAADADVRTLEELREALRTEASARAQAESRVSHLESKHRMRSDIAAVSKVGCRTLNSAHPIGFQIRFRRKRRKGLWKLGIGTPRYRVLAQPRIPQGRWLAWKRFLDCRIKGQVTL